VRWFTEHEPWLNTDALPLLFDVLIERPRFRGFVVNDRSRL
jgi:hypothetical protein